MSPAIFVLFSFDFLLPFKDQIQAVKSIYMKQACRERFLRALGGHLALLQLLFCINPQSFTVFR